jgi:hypothetical protein
MSAEEEEGKDEMHSWKCGDGCGDIFGILRGGRGGRGEGCDGGQSNLRES